MRRIVSLFKILLTFLFAFSFSLLAEEKVPQLPKFYLNGKAETPTVQELSGFLTRPLRFLVQRNNKKAGDNRIQPYALGVHEGDLFRLEIVIPAPGMRATIYRIFRDPSGSRYMSMPLSVYFDESQHPKYEEKIKPFREEFLIVVFEQTDSPHEKDTHVRYFQERTRNLIITSLRTNFTFSSLKFKMKDFAGEGAEGFFVRDAQDLVDKLIHPKRIFLVRLWKWNLDSASSSVIDLSSDGKSPLQ